MSFLRNSVGQFWECDQCGLHVPRKNEEKPSKPCELCGCSRMTAREYLRERLEA